MTTKKNAYSEESKAITERVHRIASGRLGRPPREFSVAERADIFWMAANGATDDEISTLIGCARNTLTKHCSEELARGKAAKRIEMRAHLMRRVRGDSEGGMRIAATHELGMSEAALLRDMVQQAIVSAQPMTAEQWAQQHAARDDQRAEH